MDLARLVFDRYVTQSHLILVVHNERHLGKILLFLMGYVPAAA